MSELEKWRKDHLKAVSALKELLDTAEAKLNAPVQMSFLNLRSFLQDVEVRNDSGPVGFCSRDRILHLTASFDSYSDFFDGFELRIRDKNGIVIVPEP